VKSAVTKDDYDLMQALGLALAMIGALLEREGPIPRGEFSRLLAVLAGVTSENSNEQGEILSGWAALAEKAHTARPN
jgi:hypothetical protein